MTKGLGMRLREGVNGGTKRIGCVSLSVAAFDAFDCDPSWHIISVQRCCGISEGIRVS